MSSPTYSMAARTKSRESSGEDSTTENESDNGLEHLDTNQQNGNEVEGYVGKKN